MIETLRFAIMLAMLSSSSLGLAQEVAPKARVEAPQLNVGDPAPPLSVAKWVKGQAVPRFETGKIYVIEFWATWCGPCIASMPHLSELQREHREKGLTVIGVSTVDPNNTLAQVEAMVEAKGEVMGYTVAWDRDRETSTAYMEAAQQRGIPCSFVVDGSGKIAYIGHPMWLDIPIQGLLSGTWDAATGKERMSNLVKELGAALREAQNDPARALERLERLVADYPKAMAQFDDQRFQWMLECGRLDDASVLGQRVVTHAIERRDASTLNLVSWTIVDPAKTWARRDLELALRAANKAVEFTEGKDAAILDTLARVHFLKGDVEKAISLQEKAVGLAGERLKEELQKALDEYRKARGVRL